MPSINLLIPNFPLSSYWNHQPSTPEKLQSALYSSSESDAIEILKNEPTLINQPLPNGELPLNYAIRFGQSDVVNHILQNSPAILEGTDCHDLNPVDHAILSKNKKMIQLALAGKLGFNPEDNRLQEQVSAISSFLNTKKGLSATTFATATAKNCTPPSPLSGLFEAAAQGNLALIQQRIKTVSDANTTTTDGWSLLHLAALSGNADLVIFLLEAGANPNLATTERKLSPLHIAVLGNSRAVLGALVDHQADLLATDKEGSTAAHYAATKQDLFSLQYLLERGADISLANRAGDSPLKLLLTLACSRALEKDVLKVDRLSIWLFIGGVTSIMLPYLNAGGILDDDTTQLVNLGLTIPWIASHLMALQSPKSLLGKASYISTALLSYIPGVNVINQVWKSYSVAQVTLAGLKNCWNFRHIETARPLGTAAIHLINSACTANELVNSASWAYTTTMKIAQLFNLSTKYFEEAPWESACEQRIPQCYIEFMKQEFERFEKDGWFTLQGKEVDPTICKFQDLKSCIAKHNLQPSKPSHARAILSIPENASNENCKKAYRRLITEFHPDQCNVQRISKDDCKRLTDTITKAKDTLCR